MLQLTIGILGKILLTAYVFYSLLSNYLIAQELKTFNEQKPQLVRFAVPHFPPYIYLDENNQLSGPGVQRVTRVLDNMAMAYHLELVENYGVALSHLRSGKVDGFFLATQNRHRDRIATISDSVLINNWSWFYNKSKAIDVNELSFKQSARIGTILNTNTQVWLQDNDFHITTLSSDAETLVNMLLSNRVDAVFLSESVFLHALAEVSASSTDIASVIESSRDFSVYFSHQFLASHRWFLDAFNGELAKLKASEQEAL